MMYIRLTAILMLLSFCLTQPFPTSAWEEPWDKVEARTSLHKSGHRVVDHRIKSTHKGFSIPFRVILPGDYETATDRRHGVLLLLCGASGCRRGSGSMPPYFTVWCKWTKLLDHLSSGNVTKKDLASKITTDELATLNTELAKAPFEEMIVVDLWHPGASRDTKFDRFIIDELLPFLDKTYRTIPDRRFRAIDGACGGGAIALITAFRNPSAFANCGGMQTDLGSFPNVFQFLEGNTDEIRTLGLNVNLNTNVNDVCNSYYFKTKKSDTGEKLKIPSGALAKLEARLKEENCQVTTNVFRYCNHGYAAYRYPNGHQTALHWSRIFTRNRGHSAAGPSIDKTPEVSLPEAP